MPEQTSAVLHEAILRSLKAGDFEAVRRLSAALGQAIRREVQAAPPAERAALAAGGLSRIQEHLSLARVLRAHLKSRLETNTLLCRYQPAGPPGRSHAWRFDA